MTILSSRPAPVPVQKTPSLEEVLAAAAPTVQVIQWVSSMVVYPDDSQRSTSSAYRLLEEGLECMNLIDYSIMSMPSPSRYELHYDVAIQVLPGTKFVAFKTKFKVQP